MRVKKCCNKPMIKKQFEEAVFDRHTHKQRKKVFPYWECQVCFKMVPAWRLKTAPIPRPLAESTPSTTNWWLLRKEKEKAKRKERELHRKKPLKRRINKECVRCGTQVNGRRYCSACRNYLAWLEEESTPLRVTWKCDHCGKKFRTKLKHVLCKQCEAKKSVVESRILRSVYDIMAAPKDPEDSSGVYP